MTLATLFLTAAAAFPGAPDTLQCVEFQRLDPPRITMACTQAAAAPWVIAAADTGNVRFVRSSGPEQEPMDVGAVYRGTMQLCVVLDGRAWDTCAVYLGGTLLGYFRRTGETGAGERRKGANVEDGRK